MYKKRPSKRRQAILKSLAATRKVLWVLSEQALKAIDTAGDIVNVRRHRFIADPTRAAFIKGEMKAAEIRRAYRSLQRRKMIVIKQRSGAIEAELSQKGLISGLKESVRLAEPFKDARKSCLVSFDIPIRANPIRDTLRRLLKDLDFERIHQSLWRCRRDVIKPFSAFLKLTDFGEWVSLYEARAVFTEKH